MPLKRLYPLLYIKQLQHNAHICLPYDMTSTCILRVNIWYYTRIYNNNNKQLCTLFKPLPTRFIYIYV